MSLDLSATASKLLVKLASTSNVKLVQKTDTYNPVTGEESSTSETVKNLTAAVIPMPSNLVDGTRVKSTDKMVIMDNQIKPKMTDFIRIDSVDYSIVEITAVNPSGTPQIYKVVARG